MAKLPFLQFYPADWEGDAVAGCSLAAQGLWLRMMFMMHRSERYGYLCENGLPIPTESIARRCGCYPEEYQTLYAELERSGIPSRSTDNIIFSRRMVKDAQKRELTRVRVVKHRSNAPSNAVVTPYISEVRSHTSEESIKPLPPAQTAGATQEFLAFWGNYPKKLDKDQAIRSWHKRGCEGRLGEILASLAVWKKTEQWQDYERIPYPSTFLQKLRWKESPEVSNGARQSVTRGATRAEKRVTEADRQAERVFGRSSGLVGGLRPDLSGRSNGIAGSGLQRNPAALTSGSSAPSLPESATRVATVPPEARKDLRASGMGDSENTERQSP